MINEKEVRVIFEGCGFKHRLLKTKKRKKPGEQHEQIPRAYNIEKVKRCLAMHKQMTRNQIMKHQKMSGKCVSNCINLLVDRGEVKKVFVRNVGAYKQFVYSKIK